MGSLSKVWILLIRRAFASIEGGSIDADHALYPSADIVGEEEVVVSRYDDVCHGRKLVNGLGRKLNINSVTIPTPIAEEISCYC